jgi:hypothetical protein
MYNVYNTFFIYDVIRYLLEIFMNHIVFEFMEIHSTSTVE